MLFLAQTTLVLQFVSANNMQSQATSYFRGTLHQFVSYNPTQSTINEHKRLELAIDNLTKTKQCWSLVLAVLATDSDKNVLTLASSILKNKLQYDFSQLTEDLFLKIHQSILEIISKHEKPSNSLRLNLSISLALIYIHKADQIGDLLEYLSRSFNQGQNRNYIFTILEVLPEEVDNDKVIIQEDQRVKLRAYLQKIQKNVLTQLNNISISTWQSQELRHATLLKCFSNWVRIAEQQEIVKSLHNHFLFQKAFEELSNSDLSQECSNCIKYVMKSIISPQQNPEVYRYIAGQVIGFYTKIKQLMNEDNFEGCEEFVKLLCYFGICSKKQFLTNPNTDYKNFLDSMILLTEQSELQAQIYLYEFWGQFLTLLADEDHASQFYTGSIVQLYLTLCKSLRFDLSECEQLNSKSAVQLQKVNQDFQKKLIYRDESKCLFGLLVDILVPSKCLQLSINTINNLDSKDKYFWPNIQCYLNPLQQVAERLSECSANLNSLVSKIVQIRPPYKVIQKTIIRVVSACSNVYAKNNEFTTTIFRYLSEHMKNAQMMQISSKAFENLCIYNTDFVLAHIQQFIQILCIYKSNQRILNGIMKVLITDAPTLNKYLPSIFNLYKQNLSQSNDIKKAKVVLQKFVFIFKSITKDDPTSYQQKATQCFRQLWCMMKPIIEKECKNDQQQSLLQKCTKVIKYAMRCLHHCFLPFVEEVFSSVVQSYRKYPISSYVYLLEVLVTVYYDDLKFENYIKNLFDTMCQITFNHLSSIDKVQNYPKLVQDFYGMLSRILRFMPKMVVDSPDLQSIMMFIVQCCGIQDGPIAKIFYTFLVDFFMQYWNSSFVEQYIRKECMKDKIMSDKTSSLVSSFQRIRPFVIENVPCMLGRMFKHLETGPSTTVRNCIVEALMAEIKAFSVQNRQIWIQVLSPLSQDILSGNQKVKIMGAVTEVNRENIELMQEMLCLITKRYIHRLIRSPID